MVGFLNHIGFRMKLIERLIEEGGSDSSSRNFASPNISENVVRLVGRHFPSYVESCRLPVRISSDPEVMNNGRTKKRKRVRELQENPSRIKTGKVRTDGEENGGLEIVGGDTTI
ncbi:hypothetical protein TNCV_1971701 [Trichonephila clavipes]|uniref:Uncharacterized protein n=1 Tax=Trichonephila clavipes TaxID=2585209 RepID=A0A8X7BFI1_TRICX|nr:hypothetical protein TNCV_1971701 [Trichonephila clavipes]